MSLESNRPARDVTVWGATPVFCHTSVVPGATVIDAGLNAKSAITSRPGATGLVGGGATGGGTDPDVEVIRMVPCMLEWREQMYA
jgi:hypothetical protein